MASNYQLKLSQFEGPLDLLLHLIKVNEIDIFNIDIYLLSTQYIGYLRTVNYDDLNGAGEFVEMAASLIEIKTRLLLPRNESESQSSEEEEEDPTKSLQERLLTYEAFKGAAEYLLPRPRYDLVVRTSPEWERLSPQYEHIEQPLEGDVASLIVLYEQMMTQLSTRKPPAKVEAKMHLVTVEQKILELEKLVDTVKFTLFQSFYKQFRSRYELVVYILAALELSKGGRVRLLQQELNGPLWIYRNDFDKNQLPVVPVDEQATSANIGMIHDE
ncbi:MAG: segregation/condensation protein A [Pseudobacteriovorax sp.]|nr:segregation/condensation protein A [Pseudobacteriovorax sp.]